MHASSSSPTPLASVVVPCSGDLGRLRACVAALARHTRPPWGLVAVLGDGDGRAADYLRGVADAGRFPVEVLRAAGHPGSDGFVDAGLRPARGEYLVVLDEGTVVTDGWLDQLGALADSGPAAGMVGPMFNDAPTPYADLSGMQRFAAAWRAEHLGRRRCRTPGQERRGRRPLPTELE